MYKCCNCGAIFEEPSTFLVNYGEYFGSYSLTQEEGCPFCKNDFYPINTCKECGVEINDDEEYCEKCRR